MLKAIKLEDSLDSFLNEHPEIKISFSSNGKMRQIQIPEDAIIVSLVIADNTLLDLEYIYNNKLCRFSKKETH